MDFITKRINKLIADKVNYISGTVCPASSDKHDNKLESLKVGLKVRFHDVYETLNIQNRNIVIQPKYMGSRCQIYLDKISNTKSYAVSRNGFVIKNIDLSDVFDTLRARIVHLFEKYNCKMILFDGELMPWSALGHGLISEQFDVVSAGLNELSVMKDFGFEEQYQELMKKYHESNYPNTNKKDHMNHSYEAMHIEKKHHIPIDESIEYAKLYREQMAIFGKPVSDTNPISYKPFAILKFICDDIDKLPIDMTQSEMFKLVNDDKILVLDMSDDFDSNYTKAQEFFDSITIDQQMEGIIIKPEVYADGLTPYMKVRNEKYLRIIYGYNYTDPSIYNKMVTTKHTGKKHKASINEYLLGQQMLQIDHNKLNSAEYESIVRKFIDEESIEKTCDSRL